jgi:hypothetical protein
VSVISRFVLALVLAAGIGLGLVVFLGPILADTKIPFLVTAGDAFVHWGWVIGLLFGLLAFFSGWTPSFRSGPPKA